MFFSQNLDIKRIQSQAKKKEKENDNNDDPSFIDSSNDEEIPV